MSDLSADRFRDTQPVEAQPVEARPAEMAAVDPPLLLHHAWDGDRKVRFLHHLSEKGDVRAAAARVGMSRQSAYLLRRRDRAFAQAWQAALVLARGAAEEVLATRALDGIEEEVWFRGELVGTRRRFDGRLLLAHLARLDALTETVAGDQAGRFDELLAIVAGEEPDEELRTLDGHAAEPGSVLPMAREEFVEAASGLLCEAEFEEWQQACRSGEATAQDEPPADLARYRSGVRPIWDGWQGRAFGRVDGALEQARALKQEGPGHPPMEYKSLDGPGAGFPSGLCKPCQPGDSSDWSHGWPKVDPMRERSARFPVNEGAGRRGHPPTPPTTAPAALFPSSSGKARGNGKAAEARVALTDLHCRATFGCSQ